MVRQGRSAIVLVLAVTAVVALGAPAVRAQGTVHFVVACDTNPAARLGNSVEWDATNFYNTFCFNFPRAWSTWNGVTGNLASRENVLNNIQMTPQGILNTIHSLQVAPGQDAVVFYYSGHGFYDPQQGQMLDMPQRGTLSRAAVRQAIVRKGPRLVVILTDCCSALKPVPQVPLGAWWGPSLAQPTPLFDWLLLHHAGVVDITSSRQGEISMTRNVSNEGSMFTFPLLEYLNQNNQRRLYWVEVFRQVKPRVDADFKASNPNGVDIDGDGISDQFDQTPVAFSLGQELKGPTFGARVRAKGGDGVALTQVVPGSAAARAGFEPGDVILQIDGQPIDNEADYAAAIDRAGEAIQVQLWDWRSGQFYNVSVDLNR
jgi:hypothetical protein